MSANAAAVLERLESMHNYDPRKGQYKAELGGQRVTVYKPDGTAVDVYARDLEKYVGKGYELDGPDNATDAEPVIGGDAA